ncbi:DUF4136 domain-containing protein [Solitalea canadensis]|uniref:DUF4136 domain-containing protein n=1 Tax=Solitalea canadensis (strain ATCC 29591 / DSM 3403 / JCM 21819 / LMG 8368 / NBRC 15130 / NCIMB 12057 / USAM 9D) TaxID=929556 RepID=H8KXE3_SOLCM|nr:DUF4136 domain-containing protein [Solitalea canadensis]AFD08472.1 hypothetical protein Solca_3467 [Solitalea canadensis DSM 3403]
MISIIKFKPLFYCSVILVCCTLLANGQTVKVYRDSTYNFTNDSTYKFRNGKVIINRDTVDRTQANSNMQAVFEANYFQHHLKLNPVKGQLIFTFLGGIQNQTNLATYGQQIRLPKGVINSATEQWQSDERPEGVLVLALINPKTNKPVWAAVGYDRFFTRDSQKIIDAMFKEAFENFPNKGTYFPADYYKKPTVKKTPASPKKQKQ